MWLRLRLRVFVCFGFANAIQFTTRTKDERKDYCANCIENKYISIWHIHCLLVGIGLDWFFIVLGWVGLGWAGLNWFAFFALCNCINVFFVAFFWYVYVFFVVILLSPFESEEKSLTRFWDQCDKCHRNAGFIAKTYTYIGRDTDTDNFRRKYHVFLRWHHMKITTMTKKTATIAAKTATWHTENRFVKWFRALTYKHIMGMSK